MANPSPRRLIYLSSAGDRAGGEINLQRVLQHLDTSKYQPLVLCCQEGSYAPALQQAGINVMTIPFILSRSAMLNPSLLLHNITSLQEVYKILSRPELDLIVINDNLVLKLLLPVLLLCPKPMLYMIRNYESKRLWMIDLLFRTRIKKAIAVSHSVKTYFDETLRLPPELITAINTGIDTSVLNIQKRVDIRAELGIPHHARLVGMFARFDAWKGHQVFLRAAKRILQNLPNIHFLIAGESRNATLFPRFSLVKHEVIQTTQQPALKENVHILPWREDVAAIMKEIDIVVCPSEREPFGLTIIEGLAIGTAVIAADSGGAPEAIRHLSNGILFKTNDDEDLASWIVRLLQDDLLRRQLIAQARIDIDTRFNFKRFVQTIEATYEGILQ
ncbi:MAG: glycosyltransferase family 4 protein [bacterium]